MFIVIPETIKLANGWFACDEMTVAQWREAQGVAMEGDDDDTLLQFRAATMLLMLAARHGVPEDDVQLLPLLEQLEPQTKPKPKLRVVAGALPNKSKPRPLRRRG
jgi:hypothetical protein